MPSLFQSSLPFVFIPLLALKNKVPFTLVKFEGSEEEIPGFISLTKTVPAVVPSLFQSSKSSKLLLALPLLALKNKVPFTLVKFEGKDLVLPVKISLTITVPAVVPSLFQSSMLPK